MKWDETINISSNDEFFEYTISVKSFDSDSDIYSINGYYTK